MQILEQTLCGFKVPVIWYWLALVLFGLFLGRFVQFGLVIPPVANGGCAGRYNYYLRPVLYVLFEECLKSEGFFEVSEWLRSCDFGAPPVLVPARYCTWTPRTEFLDRDCIRHLPH